MSQQVGKIRGKRSKPSYSYAIISVTLVLFMIGVLGIMLNYSRTITNYAKEQFEVDVIIKDAASEIDIIQLEKKLEKEPYVKTAEYISKDDAAKIMQDEFGDALELLEYNPLYASIKLHLNAAYADTDSMAIIETKLQENPIVEEVYYLKAVLSTVNRNVKIINWTLTALAAMLFLVALVLIDNTIKLTMYSNRFLIRSMQLVGATRWFIIKPFIGRSIANGLFSGLAAVLVIIGLLYYAQNRLPQLALRDEITSFSLIFALVIVTGMLISGISTWLAVSKYLRMKLDDLY